MRRLSFWSWPVAVHGLGIGASTWLVMEHVFTIESTYGPSMYPGFRVWGDYAMISKLHRRGRNMGVGDVAVFRHPQFADQWAVKRIAGMPGDYVCEDLPFEDTAASTGRMIQVPEGHVWVLGDNVSWSRDSRAFGPIPLGLVTGKVFGIFRWSWPAFIWFKPGLSPARIGDVGEAAE